MRKNLRRSFDCAIAPLRTRFLDVLYPPTCIGCGGFDDWLCGRCFGEIRFGESFELKPFRRAFNLSAYQDRRVQRMIKLYKYRSAHCLEPEFDRLLSRMKIDVSDIDSVTWVPGDTDRIRERGMDHGKRSAELVAKHFGNDLKAEELLLRTESVLPNASLPDNEARKGNVMRAFSCMKNLAGKRILLVDDVCTTGATAQACAEALMKSGAESVDLLVFAKG